MNKVVTIKVGGLTLAVLVLMLASALPVAGFPGGELDPTFGAGGKTTVGDTDRSEDRSRRAHRGWRRP